MSIALVVTAGYGNGTLSGTIKDVVTRGYTIGEELIQGTTLRMTPNPIKRAMMTQPDKREMTATPAKREMTAIKNS